MKLDTLTLTQHTTTMTMISFSIAPPSLPPLTDLHSEQTQIMVLAGDVMSPPATPTTTPSSVSTAPTASEPVGELQAVGLIPLAEGDGTDDERYALKVPLNDCACMFLRFVYFVQNFQSSPERR